MALFCRSRLSRRGPLSDGDLTSQDLSSMPQFDPLQSFMDWDIEVVRKHLPLPSNQISALRSHWRSQCFRPKPSTCETRMDQAARHWAFIELVRRQPCCVLPVWAVLDIAVEVR